MQLTILNTSKKFDALHDHILQVFQPIQSKLESIFDLQQLDITIGPYMTGEAPPSGIGGWTINCYRIEIQIDTERDDIKAAIDQDLASVIAHEIHHAEWFRRKLPMKTLAESLICEGLACHFEKQVNGGTLPSLFSDIQQHNWQELLEKMSDQLDCQDFNLAELFYSGENPCFPKYAGYWVGYNLVVQKMQQSGLNEFQLLELPISAFFQQQSVSSMHAMAAK